MSIGERVRALLDESGVRYRVGGRSLVLTCPRCHKKDKLYIRRQDGRFVCWVCRESTGFSGHPEWALTELLGLPLDQVKALLYGEKAGQPVVLDIQLIDFFEADETVPMAINEPLPTMEADPGFRELDSKAGKPGREYLEGRGISAEIAAQYGIVYWPSEGRIIFPVSQHGRLLGWQARSVKETSGYDEDSGVIWSVPKILTTPGLKRDRVFMFGDRISSSHVVLTEGPMDALKAHLCGGNVAAMGKAVAKQQLELLKHAGVQKLYLGLDPDAFVESGHILSQMADHMEVYDLRPPANYSDLGEMPLTEVKTLFDGAKRLDRHHIFLYLEDPYAFRRP